MTHTVEITSLNHWRVVEWRRKVTARSHAAAMRKAWAVVADCGASRDEAHVTGGGRHTWIQLIDDSAEAA